MPGDSEIQSWVRKYQSHGVHCILKRTLCLLLVKRLSGGSACVCAPIGLSGNHETIYDLYFICSVGQINQTQAHSVLSPSFVAIEFLSFVTN